jgi:hypothetical protein
MAYLQHASEVVCDARQVVRNENLNHDNAIVNLLARFATSMLPADDTFTSVPGRRRRTTRPRGRAFGIKTRDLAAFRRIVR